MRSKMAQHGVQKESSAQKQCEFDLKKRFYFTFMR